MPPSILIPALFIYPLVYLFSVNPIRFRWGFRRGLTPIPSELLERAEAADRLTLVIARLVLFATVVLLMRVSNISAYDLGFSAHNWKFPVAIGLLLSLLPVAMTAILSRSAPIKSTDDMEAHGPAGTWCALVVLGSFSGELWRAFCIVALLRSGLAAWLAVGIVAIFQAATSLQTSVARALGSAFSGATSGAVYLYTGSPLAPLTWSLIAGAAHFYQVRYVFAPAAKGTGRGGRRYSTSCPACGAVFCPAEVFHSEDLDMVACPSCGESLTAKKKNLWALAALSLGAAIYVAGHLLHSDPDDVVFVVEGLTLVFWFTGAVLVRAFVPPKYKRTDSGFFGDLLSPSSKHKPEGKVREKSDQNSVPPSSA